MVYGFSISKKATSLQNLIFYKEPFFINYSFLIFNDTGLTETGVLCIQTKHCKSIDSVGFVIEGVQMKFINVDTGKILGPNEEGEVCVKTLTQMLGYYKNQEATKEMVDEEGIFKIAKIL